MSLFNPYEIKANQSFLNLKSEYLSSDTKSDVLVFDLLVVIDEVDDDDDTNNSKNNFVLTFLNNIISNKIKGAGINKLCKPKSIVLNSASSIYLSFLSAFRI